MIGAGDAVVCIKSFGPEDDGCPDGDMPPEFPQKGSIYKVVEVIKGDHPYVTWSQPEEVYLQLAEFGIFIWNIVRFRKVEGDKEKWERIVEKYKPAPKLPVPVKVPETVDAHLNTQIPDDLPSNTRLITSCRKEYILCIEAQ